MLETNTQARSSEVQGLGVRRYPQVLLAGRGQCLEYAMADVAPLACRLAHIAKGTDPLKCVGCDPILFSRWCELGRHHFETAVDGEPSPET